MPVCLDAVPVELKKNVIGRFQFRFTTDPRDDEHAWPWCVAVLGDNATRSFFFLPDEAVMWKEQPAGLMLGNYRYLIVPAVPLMMNHAHPVAGPPESQQQERHILTNVVIADLIDRISGDLNCQRLDLRGAEGNWAVYLLSSKEIPDDRRSALITECKSMTISLCIPALEISH